VSRDWRQWYEDYDDPGSHLSRRLGVVRRQLRAVLDASDVPVRLLSLCAGDGRDTIPVLADVDVPVTGVLVELDAVLSDRARAAAPPGIEVRTADAGTTASYADACPVDVLLACGVFGNVSDADVERTVATLPDLLNTGGVVIWTRGNRVPQDPTAHVGDPSLVVRSQFTGAGFDEVAFVRPGDAGYRVGVHRWPGPRGEPPADRRLFSFV
jgi:hypothetical protein